jgi:hypothetical protein
VESTLEERFVDGLPGKLIGDRAYDSNVLDEQLKERGVELIAPHREVIGKRMLPKMDENSVAANEGGRSNGSLPGCSTIADVWCAMKTSSKTSKPSCW